MACKQNIGIIGGNGWLGSALAQAAVAASVVEPNKLMLSSRSGNKGAAASLACHWTRDNAELAAFSDVVILSVRPAQFKAMAVDLKDKLVISVMAGVSSAEIATRTQATRIVRTMPNAAAAIGRSFTPWFAKAAVTAQDRALVQAFFSASGEAAELSEEAHVDYCAGLTGAGAAFPALLAEALKSHAVARGLPPEFAVRAAKGVVCGASQLLASPDASAAAIVKEMIDYRGTTAAALEAMLARGFAEAVGAGLAAAEERGKSVSSG